jgi:hypothetical protein
VPLVSNPPWSDDLIESNYDEIEDASLPMPDMDRELGVGHYGAVYATDDDSIVFKVTSDPSEGEFIKAASLLDWPEGIVKYKAIIDFEGIHEDRPTFGIWREAAFNVGLPQRGGWDKSAEAEELHKFSTQLGAFQTTAKNARYALLTLSKDPSATVEEARELKDWAEKKRGLYYRMNMEGPMKFYASPAQRLALSINWGRHELGLLSMNPSGSYVAEALLFYLDHDIILADVHGENVGLVARGPNLDLIWVITDPGHALFLNRLG